MTHSVVGALPMGLLITSDEKVDTLIAGFQQLKYCMDESSVYYRSGMGPKLIITDNCSELHDALNQVWPETKLLLCTFHILQQVWR